MKRKSSLIPAEQKLAENSPYCVEGELSDAQRQLAFEKYQKIEPFLQGRMSLKQLCKKDKIPYRTAKRWAHLYKHKGLAGLATKQRKDRGKSRVVTNETRQAIEGFHLKSAHLSFASIFRQVRTQLTDKDLPYPKYRTVCIMLSRLPKSMTTLAHKGSKAYKQQFDLLYMRESKHSNEIWQTDHCELDIMLLNQKGAPQRPWLSIVFDDFSRCIAGYELSFLYPSILKTALALRQSIWNKKDPHWTICGIPSTLYTDHGSDFTSHHVSQVCVALKINLIFSRVAEPRGRGKIERFFLTLNQLLLCELPGYLASKSKPSLCLAELDALLRPFIIQYNQTKHSQTGVAPKTRWEQNGFLPQMPNSIEELDLLLMTHVKPRKIMRDGIHFMGLRYSDPLLADYINETVVIRYDPSDITSIRVFYANRFLCQPICTNLSEQTVNLKEIQAARNARRYALKKEIQQRISLVDTILNAKPNGSVLPQLSAQEEQANQQQPRRLKLYAAD